MRPTGQAGAPTARPRQRIRNHAIRSSGPFTMLADRLAKDAPPRRIASIHAGLDRRPVRQCCGVAPCTAATVRRRRPLHG